MEKPTYTDYLGGVPFILKLVECVRVFFLFRSLRYTTRKVINHRSAAAATAAAADILVLSLLLCRTDGTLPKTNSPLPKRGLRNILPAERKAL